MKFSSSINLFYILLSVVLVYGQNQNGHLLTTILNQSPTNPPTTNSTPSVTSVPPTNEDEENEESQTPNVEEEMTSLDERLERSRQYRMFFLQRHVLATLGWESPPNIDPETKRRILESMNRSSYVTRQKYCYYPVCDLPMVDMPDYMNRSIWFDTSSRNIRYYFNIPVNGDPNVEVTSAVVRLHLKRREDCLCAYEEDPVTSRLHIKIYQYRKPVRSHSRLRHSNMRLIDAKMVTWESSGWVTLQVRDAVKRISRGRRNGGFEVHIRDMEENVLDAKTIIDPIVCSNIGEYECSHEDLNVINPEDGILDPNYSPILEISSTTTNRIQLP